jgi:CRISPR-associated protein Cas2
VAHARDTGIYAIHDKVTNMRRRYLLSYDVRDQRRLRQARQVANRFGSGVQYSVFVCDLSETERIRLMQELAQVVHHRLDSVLLVDLGPVQAVSMRRLRWFGARPTALLEGRRDQVM